MLLIIEGISENQPINPAPGHRRSKTEGKKKRWATFSTPEVTELQQDRLVLQAIRTKFSQVLKCQELSSPILMPEAPLYLLMKGGEQTESWVHSEMVNFFICRRPYTACPPRGFYLEYMFIFKHCWCFNCVVSCSVNLYLNSANQHLSFTLPAWPRRASRLISLFSVLLTNSSDNLNL